MFRQRDAAAPGLLAAGCALALGLLEWVVFEGWGWNWAQRDVARTLVALVAVYGVCGFGLGLAGRILRLTAERVLVLPAGLLVAVAVWLKATSPLLIVAGLALGWAIVEVGCRVARWLPALQRAGLWWSGVAMLLAVTLAAGARRGDSATTLWLPLVAATGTVVLGILGLRRRGPWLSVGACVPVLAMAIWLTDFRPPLEPPLEPRSDLPAVLLITVDTLRADHVGAYGYAEARTPVLDGLAEAGVLFEQAIAPAAYTGPSHASILTGLLPERHGVLVNHFRLAPTMDTLAEELAAQGYVSGAFVSGFTTTDSSCGLPSRFDEYDDDFAELPWLPWRAYRMRLLAALQAELERAGYDFSPTYRPAAKTVDLATDWLGRNGARPFFLWLHVFDAHLPYRAAPDLVPPPETEEAAAVTGRWYALSAQQRAEVITSPAKVRRMLQLYDTEVAYADREIGRVVEAARRSAPEAGLLVVATSDHGESMGEHGLFWFRDLYEPSVRVPLVIVPPKSGDGWVKRVREQVRLIDVAPTVLELLGTSTAGMDGVSLVPRMRGIPTAPPEPAFSAIYLDPGDVAQERYAVRYQGWKILRRPPAWSGRVYEDTTEELYNLGEDPRELHDLIDSAAEIRERLSRELDRHTPAGPIDRTLTPQEEEALRSLGYVR